MKIIDVKSSEKQGAVSYSGSDAVVYLDEVIVEKEDGVSYEYTGVIVKDAYQYSEEAIVAVAKIGKAKAYLLETDWVTAKFTDSVIVNQEMTEAEFISKYAEIFTKRTEARALINSVA